MQLQTSQYLHYGITMTNGVNLVSAWKNARKQQSLTDPSILLRQTLFVRTLLPSKHFQMLAYLRSELSNLT